MSTGTKKFKQKKPGTTKHKPKGLIDEYDSHRCPPDRDAESFLNSYYIIANIPSHKKYLT